MAEMFTLQGENMTLTTAIRVLAVLSTAASGVGSRLGIARIEIGQSGTVTSAMIRGAISTRTGSTLTSTGATPAAISPIGGAASAIVSGTSAAAGTSGVNSTVDTTPTYVNLYQFNFNNLNGWLWVPTPEERMIIPLSTIWVVRLLADPTTLAGWTVTITFGDLG